MNNKYLLLTVAISALSLNACSSGGNATKNYNRSPNIVDRAIEKALANAQNDQESLTILGQMHTRDPKNQGVAIRYAQALRDDEQINASKRILEKFTIGENKSAEALTELSITNIALGDFKAAEMNALDALELSPNDGRAYLSMGTALDAQGRHQDAEVSFREGVDNWKGDPAPILNNLALNLASQGRLEQSLEILRKAKKISPHRIEIERNLRIISTLQETAGPIPPAPDVKPDAKEKTEDLKKEISKEENSKKDKAPIPPKKKTKAEEKPSDEETTKEEIVKTNIEETAKEEVEDKPKKATLKYRPLND